MLDADTWGSHAPSSFANVCLGAIRYKIARGALRTPIRMLLAQHMPFYDIEIDGLRMRCHVGDNFTENAVLETAARKDRTAIDMATGSLNQGDTFLDIGANCGLFTLFAARRVGPSGRIVAVEPLPVMVDRLRFNVRANGFGNVHIVAAAAGECEGSIILHADVGQYGKSCAVAAKGTKPLTVPVRSLADICAASGVDRIDAMKIDVEGYEDRVLIPFVRSTDRRLWPRRILLELAHSDRWQDDCLAVLKDAGYREESRAIVDVLLVR